METEILLVQNSSWEDTDHNLRAHLEISLKHVCGVRNRPIGSLCEDLKRYDAPDCVFVIPVAIPRHQESIHRIWADILRELPSPRIFGCFFALLPQAGVFSPQQLTDSSWLDILEEIYDQAIPAEFLVFGLGSPQVDWFHASMALTGMVRTIENIKEIRRINEAVNQLEERLDGIEISHQTS